MPLTADELDQLPPRIRKDFNLTHSIYVDLVAFFVEHPEDAYSRLEIRDIVQATSDVYPHLESHFENKRHLRSNYTTKLCRLGLIESVADGEYYRLADEDAARSILDVTDWENTRDGVSTIQRRRALNDQLES